MARFEVCDALLLGPFWLAGCVILGGGALLAWLLPLPSWRVRISELSIAAMVLWLALALVPMHRIGSSDHDEQPPALIEFVVPADLVDRAELALESVSARAANLRGEPTPRESSDIDKAGWHLAEPSGVWLLVALCAALRLVVGVVLLGRLLVQSRQADDSIQLVARQI